MTTPTDPDQSAMNTVPVKTALMMMRIVWFALLMAPILFMIVIALVILPHARQPAHPLPMLKWICFISFIAVVPVTYLVRLMIFRQSGPGGTIPTAAYSAGNIIFWAGCEGVAFFGLVVAMLNGSLWPTIAVVALALALQAITVPIVGRLQEPAA